MINRKFILAILLVFFLCLSSSAVFAEDASNIEDNNDNLAIGNDDVLTYAEHTILPGASSKDIQNTIDSMKEGDVLNFEKGTYNDVCIYVNKSISIKGNGATLVGYDTPSTNNTPSIITNKTADGGYGISNFATLYVINAANVTIKGLTIIGGANSASNYQNALVYVKSSDNLTFMENTLDGSSWGINLQSSNKGIIKNNTIQNQAVTGLLNFGSKATVIERNKFINAKNHGIDVRHGTGPNVQVINNTVIGSKEGIYLMHSKNHTAAYNKLINCTISSISCYGSSNIKIYNNTMSKSRIGVLLGGGHSNINISENEYKLDQLPYPPTFVYYIAESQSAYQSATNIMGTHSDSSSNNQPYIPYSEIATPDDINIDYDSLLAITGNTYVISEGASSAEIQSIINSMQNGDSLIFAKNAVYNDISIYTDKNIKIIGNNATLIGYDNANIENIPEKIKNKTANGGYGISNPAVLYSINNTNVVIANLNIVSKYPKYNPNTVLSNPSEYKTVGIRTQNSPNIAIINCNIDGASWGIYLEYCGKAIVANNYISNQYTTGILNFGTPNSIITRNTIKNAANHGIDVRHGTGPNVTVFNNTVIGAKEGIYLMHSQGHNVYNNTIIDAKISGITAYGSGNENIFNNTISGSRIGIMLGGGYYNVTIGTNTYKLDSLQFPPTFATYLAKAEGKYQSYEKAIGIYSNYKDTVLNAEPIETTAKNVILEVTLTTSDGESLENQKVTITIDNVQYNETTDENGKVRFSLALDYGKHAVSMSYAGFENYAKTSGKTSITVKEASITSAISIIEVNGNGNIVGVLKDSNGNAIAKAVISYSSNNGNATVKTNSEGKFTISNVNGKVEMKYAGSKTIAGTSADITLTNVSPAPVASTIYAKDLVVYAGNTGKLAITLKDSNGKPLANKAITVIIDGTTKKDVKTDEKGVAYLSLKYSSAGSHNIVAYFAGDDATKSSLDTAKITVNKKATALTLAKKTFKASVKTKNVQITLKTGKTVLKNKKVTLKVNGKTYTAKTNNKGVALFKITKLTKKGTYKYTVKFAGDGAYKPCSKSNNIVVKK
ncbi:right-handed parallel beta-helix repeat-containing protein [Methanobrevibacter sp.]|uniref:right-handed parallel beta-helix repeat-containing protein n=1 Tax=Methanobrevibacter sp. TaxID=66852 RepID=UPI0026E0D332|nr:right-handed parallel beta-helix repeat-containing protein [Methanobrevibacter sp.]MDO5823409.1 right-handed parallel beta-helix repeat-containing protein [Methanobrevibacter sp.]